MNPKYANAERSVFKSPTRLECMMQDYPKLLEGGKDRVGLTLYPTWYCFSPCKNNIADAEVCYKKGLPGFCAASAECDMYSWHQRMLKLAGVEVEKGDD